MTSSRLRPFGTTIFAEISALARERNAVDLGQGRPDFDGPESVIEAATRALREHPNQYAPLHGVAELRNAIAERCGPGFGGVDTDSEVTVTAGCTEALAATCLGLFEPGDRVVVFEPFYDAYVADLAMAGAEPVFVPLRLQEDGTFAFDPVELARACDGSRAILINTPHNPTGKVFSREELGVISSVAIEHDLIVLSDEVYDALVFDGLEHFSIATLPGMRERTITMGSFGKMFTMTGWKIGWTIAPPPLTTGVRAAHQFLTYAIATPLQYAAAEAISSPASVFADISRTFEAKRDRLASGLRDAGLEFTMPGGGYFILASHEPWSKPRGLADDVETCRWLIDELGVATIPPSAFYKESDEGRGMLRFAFCKLDETIDAAVERLDSLRA